MDKLSSIAFPTVGCGQLGYPADSVAACFQNALRKLRDGGHTLKVHCTVVHVIIMELETVTNRNTVSLVCMVTFLLNYHDVRDVVTLMLQVTIVAFDTDTYRKMKDSL